MSENKEKKQEDKTTEDNEKVIENPQNDNLKKETSIKEKLKN